MDKPNRPEKDEAAELAGQEAEKGGAEAVELSPPELLAEMEKMAEAQELESARSEAGVREASGKIAEKIADLGEGAPPELVAEHSAQRQEAEDLAKGEKAETGQARRDILGVDLRAEIDKLEGGWAMPDEGEIPVEGLDRKLILQEEQHGEFEAKPAKEGKVEAAPKVAVEEQPIELTPDMIKKKPVLGIGESGAREIDLGEAPKGKVELGEPYQADKTMSLEEWKAAEEKRAAGAAADRTGEGFRGQVVSAEQVARLRQLDSDNKRLREINKKLGELGAAAGTPAFVAGELEAEKAALEEKIAKAQGEQAIDLTPEMRKKKPEGEGIKAEVREMSPKEKEMRAAGDMVAELQAKLHQFEGLGMAKLLLPGNRLKRENILADLENAKKEYAELRAEVVADNVDKFCDERMTQVEAHRAALEKQKGKEWLSKGYQWYKKLGEMNLTKLGWNPTGRVGRVVARAMSVRTLVSLGLLGAGLAAGAGAAVGAGAIVSRRLLAGIGTGVGSYDLMRMAAERQPGKFKPEDLGKMSKEEVADRLEKMEANAMVGGRSLDGNEAYGQLDGKLRELLKAEQAEMPQESRLVETMKSVDDRLEAAVGRSKRNDKIMKAAAAGIAGFVGGGVMAKAARGLTEYLGLTKPPVPTPEAVQTAKVIGKDVGGEVGGEAAGTAMEDQLEGKAPAESPEAGGGKAAAAAEGKEVSPPTPEQKYGFKIFAAAEVQKGDSYNSLIRRQLLADPERFGYDPAKHGDKAAWARELTSKTIRDNNLISSKADMRLVFDAKNPGHVYLEKVGDKLQVVREGVKQYAHPFEAAPAKGVGEAAGGALPPKPPTESGILTPEWVKETPAGTVTEPAPEAGGKFDFYKPEHRNLGNSWIARGATRESLRALADASARGGEFLNLQTADGRIIRVAGGIDAKMAAKAALERLGEKGTGVGAPVHEAEVAAAKIRGGDIPEPFKAKDIPPPLTKEDIPTPLTKEDIPPALTKKDIPPPFAAEDAPKPLAAEVQALNKDLAAATEKAKDLMDAVPFSAQETGLGRSWIERGATLDSLKKLADAPARGGEWMELKTVDGKTIRVRGGIEAKRAAKAALRILTGKK